jgi:glyoxylase-like metal-dependent hydrolase (beta-lactamase superfamily II)
MLRYQIIPVTAFAQNCSLIWCDETKDAVLVDAGGDVGLLKSTIEANGVKLKAIWLTHGHLDHAGGAQDLREQLGIPVIGPTPGDDFWLAGIEQQSQMYGMQGLRNVEPDEWLSEGQVLTLGNETLSVLETPGHTPGHIVFYHEKQKLAWVGDVLFAGSIGRTDFPKGDHATLINSITQKLWPLGDDVRFIPGHGPESTFGVERQTNPFVSDAALAR